MTYRGHADQPGCGRGEVRKKHDTFITLEESLERAKPKLPPLAQLDISHAIVGVGARGSLRGAYATIRVFKSDDEVVGSVQVRGGLLGTKFLFVAKEVPFEELSTVLTEQAGVAARRLSDDTLTSSRVQSWSDMWNSAGFISLAAIID